MATWNADKPAVGNEISADIPDIEENFQELHDVIAAITNGTLGTTTAANFLVDAVSVPIIWLKDSRARFEWKDADEIYIHAGAYHHVGTVSQVVYWSSKLTSDIGSPDASDMYYLYIDDSAVVTLGTNLLTTTELLWSNTEPAWSETKHGHYNGEDRCIFAVKTDSSSNILEFFHDGGGYMAYADFYSEMEASDVDTTWTDIDMATSVPSFSTKATVSGRVDLTTTANAVIVYWRTNGQSGTTGHVLTAGERLASDQFFPITGVDVITDSSQIIEVKVSRSSGDTVSVYVDGWHFPTGM